MWKLQEDEVRTVRREGQAALRRANARAEEARAELEARARAAEAQVEALKADAEEAEAVRVAPDACPKFCSTSQYSAQSFLWAPREWSHLPG